MRLVLRLGTRAVLLMVLEAKVDVSLLPLHCPGGFSKALRACSIYSDLLGDHAAAGLLGRIFLTSLMLPLESASACWTSSGAECCKGLRAAWHILWGQVDEGRGQSGAAIVCKSSAAFLWLY